MRLNVTALILFLSLTYIAPVNVLASSSTYCAAPPFLTSSIPANILFVIDTSGSMSWPAYYKGWTDTNVTQSYNGTLVYEGYFDPQKKYKLTGGIWKETNDPHSCQLKQHSLYVGWLGEYWNWFSADGVCTGNELNFARMDRIDLLRWAVTGGKPETCKTGNYNDINCDPDLACPGSTCVLEGTGNYDSKGNWVRDKVEVPKKRIKGVVQLLENTPNPPRIGVLFFSKGLLSDKVYIGDYPNGNKADPNHRYTYFKRYVDAVDVGGSTGTAIAMWEAYDYFRQDDNHTYSNGFNMADNKHPYWDPMNLCDASGANCTLVPCTKNFVILLSDGQWNYGGNKPSGTCSIDSGFLNYSADPVVPAYEMHTQTLRQLDGRNVTVSSVYTLGLFLGGTGERALQNVAMYGAYDTTNGPWPDSLTGFPTGNCTMDDCGPGKGSACTPLPPSSLDWDQNKDNIPDTFFTAYNAGDIKYSLLAFLRDIRKKTSSGSSVSILSTKAKKGSVMTQAVFYPQKRINGHTLLWPGYLNTYWFLNVKTAQNIREDNVNATFLDLLGDNILDFNIDPSSGALTIDAYHSAANGTRTTKATTYFSLDEVHKVWEAGDSLKSRPPQGRRLLFSFTPGEMHELNATTLSVFQDSLGTDLSQFPSCLGSNLTAARNNLGMYLYGQDIAGCRSRDTGSGTWKLGDIIYSTPQIVDYPNYSLLFVGANDGMLHAFRVGKVRSDGLGENQVARICDDDNITCTTVALGKEEWAFVPKNAMPYLRYLADPHYCHLYYVDLAPYIIERDTNRDGTVDQRVLIGGMRLGGACGCSGTDCVNPPSDTCPSPSSSNCTGLSSYFALDITDPQAPKFLWEFSDPKLAFSYSGPAYIQRRTSHFVMFLSGPTNYDGEAGQDLKVFVLKLNDDFTLNQIFRFDGAGTDPGFTKRSALASYKNAFGGRLLSEGVDFDDNGTTDAVFFGVTQKVGTNWQGNVIAVTTNSDDPNTWGFDNVFNSATGPVTAKVEYLKCFNMNFIYFGTGRWFFKTDEEGSNATSDVEKLYGIRMDECAAEGAGHCSLNNAHSSADVCNFLDSTNSTQNVAWYVDSLEPKGSTYFKERAVTDPTASMDMVFFTTMEPSADLCAFGGRSRIWALNCATGGSAFAQGCNNATTVRNVRGTLLLQLSGGNIEDVGLESSNFSSSGTTSWFVGTPPETATPFVPPSSLSLNGVPSILFWLER